MRTTAIVLAAGKGKRMGGSQPKQYLEINGKPILYYSIQAFEQSRVDDILLVCSAADKDMVQHEIVSKYGLHKVTGIVEGGKERYDSVYQGLLALKQRGGTDIVMIHDGARPFIRPEVIDRFAEQMQGHDAVIAGMPVKDTIKVVDDQGNIVSTTERRKTWMAQTPQCFSFEKIFQAYDSVLHGDTAVDAAAITDDAMIFSSVFPLVPVKMEEAGYENIKITTPDDLTAADCLLKDR